MPFDARSAQGEGFPLLDNSMTQSSIDNIENQNRSDAAYHKVLAEFELPQGTKLHEDKNRVRRWQYHFNALLETKNGKMSP